MTAVHRCVGHCAALPAVRSLDRYLVRQYIFAFQISETISFFFLMNVSVCMVSLMRPDISCLI